MEHSEHQMPDEFEVGDAEKKRLAVEWRKIQKKRSASPPV